MKRFSLLAVVLSCSSIVQGQMGAMSAVHASGVERGHGYDRAVPTIQMQGQSAARRIAPLAATRQASVSGSVQSPAQLRLPASAFPPGSYLYEEHGESSSQADDSRFSDLHPTPYSALAMQGGWFQYYTTELPDGLFDVAYLGSYYPSSSDANRAFADVRNNPNFANGSTCSFGDRCYEDWVGTTFSDGEYQGLVRVVQSSNALMEVLSVVPAADLASRQNDILADVNRVSAAFIQAAASPVPNVTPTATAMPSTTIPTSTATPPLSVPSTSTPAPLPSATPTNTPVPLFVTMHLAHKIVNSGKKQTVSVTTRANASVTVVVTFPDEKKVRGFGTASADGHYSWAFKQPTGHTTATKRIATVLVTATLGSNAPVTARGSYLIR